MWRLTRLADDSDFPGRDPDHHHHHQQHSFSPDSTSDLEFGRSGRPANGDKAIVSEMRARHNATADPVSQLSHSLGMRSPFFFHLQDDLNVAHADIRSEIEKKKKKL